MIGKILKKTITKLMIKRGYSPFYAWDMWGSQWDDLLHNRETSWRQKIWAHKRGFLSNRISSYGLTEANYSKYLSDFEYKKLHPINGFYSRWIDDKLTIRYLLEPFREYLPEYYFQVTDDHVLGLPDLLPGYSTDTYGITQLLRHQGDLAFKPMTGSRGKGFYRLSFADNNFLINNEVNSREKVLQLLRQAENSLVTEYLTAHDDIRRIYPGSPNTVRVLVMKPPGGEIIFSNAHIRIGTNKSGVVDFTPENGIFSNIDLETGQYCGCIRFTGHRIDTFDVHPDTGIRVEGILPHLELIKRKLIEISQYVPQLRFMGYDIVVTKDRFKIIEINSHPMIGAQQHLYPMFRHQGSRTFFDNLKKGKLESL